VDNVLQKRDIVPFLAEIFSKKTAAVTSNTNKIFIRQKTFIYCSLHTKKLKRLKEILIILLFHPEKKKF
jgi:hypothetical protein